MPTLRQTFAWLTLAVGVLAFTSLPAAANQPTPAAKAPPKPQMAVATFTFEKEAAPGVAAQTLTDLLVKVGKEGFQYEACPPTEYLKKVIDRIKTEGAATGKLSEGDLAKAKARFLLMPTLTRLEEDWVMTATLIDLESGESRVLDVTRKGGGAAQIREMIGDLWSKVNALNPKVLVALKSDSVPGLWSMSISPDGKLLATGVSVDTAQLWEVGALKKRFALEATRGTVAMSFSQDGKFLATVDQSETTARLWDVETGKELAALDHNRLVKAVSFSPDGKLLATGSANDNLARLWDVKTRKELFALKHQGDVTFVSFSPDGKLLLTMEGLIRRTARLWDVETGKERAAFKETEAILISPDGKDLAIASGKTVRLWSWGNDYEKALLKHDDDVLSMAFSPDGAYLLRGSRDGTARMWDIEAQKEIGTIKHDAAVQFVSFSPDGRLLVTAYTGNSGQRPDAESVVRLWEVKTGKEVAALKHDWPSKFVLFSSDGKLLVTGGSGIKVWSLFP